MRIKLLDNQKIENALTHEYRQYLTGYLQRPQEFLPCIPADIEVGISFYHEFTVDKPHYHSCAVEYNYVLQGCIKIRLLDEPIEEYEFHPGDFFI